MIIGLTGKSCSGKNFASEYMTGLGWTVLDLDVIAHDALNKKASEILKEFGTTDRKQIGKIVFNDYSKLQILESILYPSVVDSIVEASKTNATVVANGALLYRAGIDKICKFIIYIDASYSVRCKRAMERDSISESDFKLRDSAQNDVHYNDVHYRAPVYVIDNNVNGSEQLVEVCKKITLGQDTL